MLTPTRQMPVDVDAWWRDASNQERTTFTADELVAALRAEVRGSSGALAEVELVVADPDNLAFVASEMVSTFSPVDGERGAEVDWDRVSESDKSHLARRGLLLFAGEIAGWPSGLTLGDLVATMSMQDLVLVLRALYTAGAGTDAPAVIVAPLRPHTDRREQR